MHWHCVCVCVALCYVLCVVTLCCCLGNQYSMPVAQHQLIQQQPMHSMHPSGTQAQFSAATTHTGLMTSPPAVVTHPAMMLVQQPTQAHAAMYAPTTPMQMGPATPMQMAGVPMSQVGVGGQNPGGRESQLSSFSLVAEGGGGVQYIEYPGANNNGLLVAPPPYYSSDATAAIPAGQIQ